MEANFDMWDYQQPVGAAVAIEDDPISLRYSQNSHKKSKKGKPTPEELAFKKAQSANKKAEREAVKNMKGGGKGKKKKGK